MALIYGFVPSTKQQPWPQNPVAIAVRNIRMAIPDLILAAHEARTTDQALAVKQEIDDLMIELQAAADTAMDMAERNIGGRD